MTLDNTYSFKEKNYIKSYYFREIREIRLFHYYWRKTFTDSQLRLEVSPESFSPIIVEKTDFADFAEIIRKSRFNKIILDKTVRIGFHENL